MQDGTGSVPGGENRQATPAWQACSEEECFSFIYLEFNHRDTESTEGMSVVTKVCLSVSSVYQWLNHPVTASGIAKSTCLRHATPDVGTSTPKTRPKRAPSGEGTGCLRLFFLPFFLLSIGFLYALSLRPLLQMAEARHWTETPCVIDSSQVGYHHGEDSTSYSIDITYHYTSAGQAHTSQRYGFALASSPGLKRKQAIVDRYPPGKETVCFVNPAAPAEAVLDRGWRPEMALGALGLVFAVVTGLGMIFAGRLGQGKSPIETMPKAVAHTGGPLTLTPQYTPVGKLLGVLIGTWIWNGIIGFIAYFLYAVADWQDVSLVPKIIVGLFLLVGVLLLFTVCANLLALLNPRVRITLQNPSIRAGDELSLSWTTTGRAGRLRKLRVTLEGRRAVAEGTTKARRANAHILKEVPVFETTNPEFLTQGAARVTIPTTPPPDCEDQPGSVAWHLHVRGEISGAPNLNDEYLLNLQPRPLEDQ